MVLAAVIGGGVTAAALLGAGAVDGGDAGDGDRARRSPPRAWSRSRRPRAAGSARARSTSATRRAWCSCARRRCAPTRTPFDVYSTTQPTEATGSGFVIDEDGLILTNAHVVAAATEIRGDVLRRAHGQRQAGRQGPRHRSRAAAGRPRRARPAPARAGRLRTVQVGDPTVAIGNPFGLERTLTTGVDLGAAAAPDRAERVHDRQRDPDRRGAQPGQLGRPADRRVRPRDRDQLADRDRRRAAAAASGSASPCRSTRPRT